MIKVLLSGACGKMGNAVTRCCKDDNDIEIIAGVDRAETLSEYKIYKSFDDINANVNADVIIDFSNVAVLDGLLKYATNKHIPVILATTGYSDEQINKIKSASKKIPVFFTANMSLGVNLLSCLAKFAAKILGSNFDVEIVEKHHNQKLDAPSGTALMLANTINDVFDDKYHYEYDRHSKRQKRSNNEIGIHAVRGGTIVGEHDVIFAGHDEVITLSHSAQSKEVFATGAIKAAKFIVGKPNGMYNMSDVLNLK